MGRAIGADGVGTVIATRSAARHHHVRGEHRRHGGDPRLLHRRLLRRRARGHPVRLSPKFGALVAATPGGVLGGITVVLYGMIGLLGAKIWKENGVDFAQPDQPGAVAAGIIIAIGDTSLEIHRQLRPQRASRSARSSTIVGYHLAGRWLRRTCDGPARMLVYDQPAR